MRGLVIFLIIGVLSFIAGLFLPWWSVALVAFIVSVAVGERPGSAFLTAFLAVFLFWFGYSYFQDLANDSILSSRISFLFLGTQSPILMNLVTGLVGGLVAGMGGLTGAFLRKKKEKEKVFKPSYLP